jgi:hypothetical protein
MGGGVAHISVALVLSFFHDETENMDSPTLHLWGKAEVRVREDSYTGGLKFLNHLLPCPFWLCDLIGALISVRQVKLFCQLQPKEF